jgi:hypothetical protein
MILFFDKPLKIDYEHITFVIILNSASLNFTTYICFLQSGHLLFFSGLPLH